MSCLFLAGVTNWLGIKLIFNRIPGVFFRYNKTIYVADFAETKESGRLLFCLFFFSCICSTAHGCHDPLRKKIITLGSEKSLNLLNETCSASTLTLFQDCPKGTVNESETSGQFYSFLHVVMPEAEAL